MSYSILLQVGNQDHSCMLGVEAVDNILHGTKEFTLFYPSLVSEGGERGRLSVDGYESLLKYPT